MKTRNFLLVSICVFSFVFFSCSKPGDSKVSHAVSAYGEQNYDKALELFNEALNEETSYSDELIYNFIGNVYLAKDEGEKAAEYFEKALRNKPDYFGLVRLGSVYYNLENAENAQKTFERAIELNPDKAEAYASLGILFMSQNKIQDAVTSLEKAESIEKQLAVVPANLAVCWSILKDRAKAEEALARAEKLKCENLDEYRARVMENFANE